MYDLPVQMRQATTAPKAAPVSSAASGPHTAVAYISRSG
jgi:hypothetical protein